MRAAQAGVACAQPRPRLSPTIQSRPACCVDASALVNLPAPTPLLPCRPPSSFSPGQAVTAAEPRASPAARGSRPLQRRMHAAGSAAGRSTGAGPAADGGGVSNPPAAAALAWQRGRTGARGVCAGFHSVPPAPAPANVSGAAQAAAGGGCWRRRRRRRRKRRQQRPQQRGQQWREEGG